MTKILAFGSFKQSGKSSTCEFLKDYIGRQYKYYQSNNQPGDQYSVKIYSFADKLKQFCVECLGLSEAQCYGTDDDKNSLTHLKWENMPGVITPDQTKYFERFETSSGWSLVDQDFEEDLGLVIHPAGYMTAREVLQYFGTGICRKMYSNIWVDSCLRQIKKDNLDFALIADCRFRNEAEAIQKAGGKAIGFMRRPFPNDTHQSEVDLIGYPFDVSIDNTDLTLDEKNKKVLGLLKEWNWL
jgi:hypothetical protein